MHQIVRYCSRIDRGAYLSTNSVKRQAFWNFDEPCAFVDGARTQLSSPAPFMSSSSMPVPCGRGSTMRQPIWKYQSWYSGGAVALESGDLERHQFPALIHRGQSTSTRYHSGDARTPRSRRVAFRHAETNGVTRWIQQGALI